MWSVEEFLEYWFGPDRGLGIPDRERLDRWFSRDRQFAGKLRRRFLTSVMLAGEGGLDHWLKTPEGYLAVIILLDQVSRHIYYGTGLAYELDRPARRVVREALEKGYDASLSITQRVFVYLPLSHSERLSDQKESVQLFAQLESTAREEEREWVEEFRKDAERRLQIIKEFGRFPHRNKVLGRASRPEELIYLGDDEYTFRA